MTTLEALVAEIEAELAHPSDSWCGFSVTSDNMRLLLSALSELKAENERYRAASDSVGGKMVETLRELTAANDRWIEQATAAESALSQVTKERDEAREELATGTHFLTAYASADGKESGIDHPTDADWNEVRTAHVALRDWLNYRIENEDKCPLRPSPARAEGAEEGTFLSRWEKVIKDAPAKPRAEGATVTEATEAQMDAAVRAIASVYYNNKADDDFFTDYARAALTAALAVKD